MTEDIERDLIRQLVKRFLAPNGYPVKSIILYNTDSFLYDYCIKNFFFKEKECDWLIIPRRHYYNLIHLFPTLFNDVLECIS